MRLLARRIFFLLPMMSGAAGFAAPGPVTECIDYRDYAPHIESMGLSGAVRDLVLASDLLWIAAGDQGLLVYSIEDPFAPQLVASAATHAPAEALAIAGERAYVAEGAAAEGGLEIFDIGDPSSPASLGRVATSGDAVDVTVGSEGIAYIADSSLGVQVIDISQPATPSIMTTVDLGTPAYNLEVAGTVLVVAAYAGVVVLDIASPATPVIADTRGMSPRLVDVAVEEHYAFAYDWLAHVRIVDFADPYNVTGGLLGSRMPGAIYGYDIVTEGDRGFVLDDFGLEVYDITPVLSGTDPERPATIGSIPITGSDLAVHLAAEVAYVGAGDRLKIVDLSVPIAPPVVTSIPDPWWPRGFDRVGDTLYFAEGSCCYWARLVMLEASNPDSMTVIGMHEGFGRGGFVDIAVSDQHAYVTDEGHSEISGAVPAMHVFDISDPAAPAIVGQHILEPTWNAPGAIDADGNAAVMSTVLGLEFLDVSDPTDPRSVATLNGYASDIHLRDTWAFLLYGGLRVFDISELAAPVEVASLQLPAPSKALLPVDDTLYVLGARRYGIGPVSVSIIDISDPTTPVLEGCIEWEGRANGFAVAEDHAYVSLVDEGLRVIDISEVAAPQVAGDLRLLGTTGSITTHRGRLLISTYGAYQVLPLQCPGPTPVLLSSFTASPADRAIVLRWCAARESDHLGYRIERGDGVGQGFRRVGPELVRGGAPYEYEWRDDTVAPGRAYWYRLVAVDMAGGTEIFGPIEARLDPAPVWRLGEAQPNPACALTAVPFVVGAEDRIRLRIYDVGGRLVRTLVDRPLPAGRHRAVWRGRTNSGRRAAAGTYFLDLRASQFHEQRKIVLIPR